MPRPSSGARLAAKLGAAVAAAGAVRLLADRPGRARLAPGHRRQRRARRDPRASTRRRASGGTGLPARAPSPARTRAAPSATRPDGGSAGRRTSATSPPPSRGPAAQSPPCASATARTSDRPTPAPWPAPAAQALEGLEQRPSAPAGTTGPAVLDPHSSRPSAAFTVDPHEAAAAVVEDRVLGQVPRHPLEQPAVAGHDGRLGRHPHSAPRGRPPAAPARLLGRRRAARPGPRARPRSTTPASLRARASRLSIRRWQRSTSSRTTRARRRSSSARRRRVGQRHLELGAHHGQGRAQLVRGVGHEPPLAREGAPRGARACRRRSRRARAARRRARGADAPVERAARPPPRAAATIVAQRPQRAPAAIQPSSSARSGHGQQRQHVLPAHLGQHVRPPRRRPGCGGGGRPAARSSRPAAGRPRPGTGRCRAR